MSSKKINLDILEQKFEVFSNFILKEDGKPFSSFVNSNFINNSEGYKYTVYNEARGKLGNKWWKPEDIGTGKIQDAVNSAIQTSVIHNYERVDNNLVDWRKKDKFKKLPNSKSLENLLFEFYKSKRKDEDCFQEFLVQGISYQFIAYLFFIKNYNRFMPISQERFDQIFELLGVEDFKTSGNVSWKNYTIYLDLIKQTKNFLRTKNNDTTLLDAHTFLWVLGQIYIDYDYIEKSDTTIKVNENVQEKNKVEPEIEPSEATELSVSDWSNILLDGEITNDFGLSIFQALYSFQDQKAYASQIAILLDMTHPPLNLEIGRYAKRIAVKYNVEFTRRDEEKFKYWDLFFIGWYEESKFIWQLKPELKKALEKNKLTDETLYADELPQEEGAELYEGMKKSVTVNSYERNPKARELCIKHWKAKCAVCDFDFEKVYGKIGKGFIHVHHLTPVSQVGKTYQVNPKEDLIPVCPNCHSIIHKKEPPFTINEMKSMLKK